MGSLNVRGWGVVGRGGDWALAVGGVGRGVAEDLRLRGGDRAVVGCGGGSGARIVCGRGGWVGLARGGVAVVGGREVFVWAVVRVPVAVVVVVVVRPFVVMGPVAVMFVFGLPVVVVPVRAGGNDPEAEAEVVIGLVGEDVGGLGVAILGIGGVAGLVLLGVRFSVLLGIGFLRVLRGDVVVLRGALGVGGGGGVGAGVVRGVLWSGGLGCG